MTHLRRGGPALLLALLLILPLVANAAPSIVVDVRVTTIQRLVDGLLAVPQIRDGIGAGESLSVDLVDGHFDTYRGTMTDGRIPMARDGSVSRTSTHTISMSGAAAVSLANAYDPANTAKLLIKGGYISVTSERQTVQLAFNALAKTPADTRLASYTPALGDTISYGGCTGTLNASATAGYFQVRLCAADYVVNALGGVNGKLPNIALSDVCSVSRFGTFCSSSGVEPSFSGGDDGSIRDTCRAAFGPRPRDPFTLSILWDYRVTQCISDNYLGGA